MEDKMPIIEDSKPTNEDDKLKLKMLATAQNILTQKINCGDNGETSFEDLETELAKTLAKLNKEGVDKETD